MKHHPTEAMPSSEHKCSIVMPCYNARAYIGMSIESVRQQSHTNWELLIVDDASTDESAAFIEQMYVRHDPRIRLLRLSVNSGAAVARNTGIAEAKGRFIAFLDSDDCWTPTKLEVQIAFMLAQHCPISFTAYTKRDVQGRHLSQVAVPARVDYAKLLKTNVIGCLTAMYDTSCLGKVYMPLIRKRQDFGLWLRILKLTQYAYGINVPLAHYTVRPNSISASKTAAAKHTWQLYREIEGLNLIKSSYYFFHYSYRGYLRTKFPLIARRLGLFD